MCVGRLQTVSSSCIRSDKVHAGGRHAALERRPLMSRRNNKLRHCRLMGITQETCSWPVRSGARHYRHHGCAGCGVDAVNGPAGSPRDGWRSGRNCAPCLQFAGALRAFLRFQHRFCQNAAARLPQRPICPRAAQRACEWKIIAMTAQSPRSQQDGGRARMRATVPLP